MVEHGFRRAVGSDGGISNRRRAGGREDDAPLRFPQLGQRCLDQPQSTGHVHGEQSLPFFHVRFGNLAYLAENAVVDDETVETAVSTHCLRNDACETMLSAIGGEDTSPET